MDISRRRLWKPLLHEVAAGPLDSQVDAIEFLAQAHSHGFRFRLGRFEGLERMRREVRLGATKKGGASAAKGFFWFC